MSTFDKRMHSKNIHWLVFGLWRLSTNLSNTPRIYINFVARPFHYHFRDKVMQIMREVDPAGVEFRRRRRIKRKVYYSCGPNYTWHVDGYVIDRSL